MTKVLGMGNALVDVLAIIENDGLLETLDLPKGSMQLIDDAKFKMISEEIGKLKTDIVSGGSASNTIVGLAKLGVETGFLGRIGKDFFGKYYKDDLIKNNINTHLIEADEASGVASTFISKDGERTFGTYLGAAALLKADDLKKEDFEGYDYFYIEGYLVQNYDLIRTAIQLAKAAGAKVILDMASYNIVEESRDFLLEIIPRYVDIVFANQQEAETLLDLDVEETIGILAQRTDIAIVKVGAKGSWIQRGEEKVLVPALKVSCVDSTGAGDSYASGFIYGLINNYPLSVCGEIGTLLAGEVIQEVGAKINDNKWESLIKQIKQMA
ncbi:sugar/nucleoside kinase (ribokinase family) [Dysgonomonas hofstadii]|uniref:Sugar/nucleoside kinase (Ribokinase family) n=1 Tax=Dysgonomonas hofstadii TaxID=637886 RepID=A0A840CRG1_9BACT|nr:adenosine kinase [Dysgonomonas hofstadii]MBB4036738.1 sugar/nucleoside kinase (ribokinase family) [Dysgonomonas hofstadii]